MDGGWKAGGREGDVNKGKQKRQSVNVMAGGMGITLRGTIPLRHDR